MVSDEQKVWRRLADAKVSRRVDSLTVTGSSVFADQEIEFGAFTVLCGLHGTGKSFLLRLLEELTCNYWSSDDSPPVVTEQPGRFVLRATSDGVPIVRAASFTEEVGTRWDPQVEIAPFAHILRPESMLRMHNIWIRSGDAIRHREDLYNFDSVEMKTTARDREGIVRILGLDYTDHRMWDTTWCDRSPIPLEKLRSSPACAEHMFVVEASRGGRAVQNKTMSYAELWVHHCLGPSVLRVPTTSCSSTSRNVAWLRVDRGRWSPNWLGWRLPMTCRPCWLPIHAIFSPGSHLS